MKLRVVESAWTRFIAALCARKDVESAGIVLAEPLQGGEVLVARELREVPDDGYLIRCSDRLRIDPITLNRVVRPARDRKLSVLTIHTHPGTREPWFSLADDMGDSRLMPSLYVQTPGPHGSLVVAGDSGETAGRLFLEGGEQRVLELSTVGQTVGMRRAAPEGADEEACFARQRLALGEAGQSALRNLHVAIVGLGGTGSVVFVQLAHLGVGKITVVDGDIVESSNVSRILGAKRGDDGLTHKVDVAARYARDLGLGTEVRVVRGHLGQDVAVDELDNCDVIFSCVDRHTPRAILNRLAYRNLVPVIDTGSAFRVDPTGRIVAGAGRVVIVGPERPCLCCWGHIDPDRLRLEALSAADRANLAADGYVSGADIPEPSVVAFNTLVSGAAVVEFLRLVTAFAGGDDPPLRLAFDFETGLVRRNRLSDKADCSICLPGHLFETPC